MNYGLYISTSGALHAAYRQDLLTSNLANINTVGFKPDIGTTRQRDAARVEDDLGYLPSNTLMEKLGAGVMAAPTRTMFIQGAIRETGNDMDLAIRGEGFFALLDEQDRSQNRIRLTRDGRFTLDAGGRMVSVTNGMPVVGSDGRVIQLDPTHPLTVMPDGAIIQNGAETARVDFVEIGSRDSLQKIGNGLFRPDAGQLANRRPASGYIEQHALEDAAVNEIDLLMDIESAARDAQANLGMISYHDRLLDQAINRFARTA